MGKRKYEDFIASKLAHNVPTGIEGAECDAEHLFPFQRDLVRWALRRGRAAIFASTGMGKTRMQVEWASRVAQHTGKPVLILAPLAVAQQTSDEARECGVSVAVVKDGTEVSPHGVFVTNYDRLHRFDTSVFGGVVLDESSLIKHHTSKTLQQLVAAFSVTPFKLCLTATPSPNDYTELGTHAEFLGICTRSEMLSEFFVHDGGETSVWRLKGHARKVFWKFVASWGALIRSPGDLGYDASAYELPPLNLTHHTIEADDASVRESGFLFAMPASGLMERRNARKASLSSRVAKCVEMVNASSDSWVVWCDLNAEGDELEKNIDGSAQVSGSMTTEQKESVLAAFARGDVRVLISKSSICGWGLNWQHCSHMAFVGVTDSWEAYYQAVRRIYRFGQKRECHVHIFASDIEGSVVANLARKERDANAMADELSRETGDAVRESVLGSKRETNEYAANHRMELPSWL